MTSVIDVASSEEVALFNPGFLARLLHRTLTEFQGTTPGGMSVALVFLAIPLVLHKPTRDDLPRNSAAQMQRWIRENPRHLVGLPERVIRVRPFTGFAIRFGLVHGVLTAEGSVMSAGEFRRRPPGFAALETTEVDECLRAAGFLGRWFARQADAATVLAWWGLRP